MLHSLQGGEVEINIANKVTMARIALIPVFLVVLYIGFPNNNYIAMGIFILAGLTDIADGYIARKRGEVTDFGKFIDPLADKVLVVSAMLWYIERGMMPAWAALIVIIREFMVQALRLIAVTNGRVIAAEVSGKIKTIVTMICLSVMFLHLEQWMISICIIAIIVTTVFSGIEYFVRNRDTLNWNTY